MANPAPAPALSVVFTRGSETYSMAFTAQDVMELKNATNAGMMECKKALTEAHGDRAKAIDLLRQWGVAKGATPKSTEMREGLVAAKLSDDSKLGVIIRLGCQTDFVARNELFTKLLNELLNLAFNSTASTPQELIALPYPDGSGRTVDAVIKELIGSTVKENIEITGLARFTAPHGIVAKYVHHNAKVGTLIQIDGAANDAAKNLGSDIAMHITAGMPQVPVAVDRSGIPAEVVAREAENAKEGIDPKKPPQIQEKIVSGKLDKAFGEIVLLEQPYVKDDKQKVRELVAVGSKAAGAPLTIVRFARLKVGEA